MKLLADFFPIVVFVVAYFVSDSIFVATVWLMAATSLYLAIGWFFFRRLDRIYFFTFLLLLIFGGATLILRDPRLIQLKPTIATWLMAIIFYASNFIGRKPLIEKVLGSRMELPSLAWRRLTEMWAVFFLVSGAVNLFVVMSFSEAFWVSFKLYGQLILTLIFIVIQGIYVSLRMKTAR